MGHEARRSIADAAFFFSEFGACFLDTIAGKFVMQMVGNLVFAAVIADCTTVAASEELKDLLLRFVGSDGAEVRMRLSLCFAFFQMLAMLPAARFWMRVRGTNPQRSRNL